MDNSIAIAISAILGGGLFKGIEALYRAITDSREKKSLIETVGLKTPAEVESVSVATMSKALESAQNRIVALESERNSDREYYQGRIKEYQDRIKELDEQIQRIQLETADVSRQLSELRAESNNSHEREVRS